MTEMESAIRLPEALQRPWVTIQMVLDEIGYVLDEMSAVFPEDNRERILGDWIFEEEEIAVSDLYPEIETFLTEYSTEFTDDDNKTIHQIIYKFKKGILYIVCSRVLGRAQTSRRSGSDLSYRSSKLWYEDRGRDFILQAKLELAGLDWTEEEKETEEDEVLEDDC